MKKKDFGKKSAPRNFLIASLMLRSGYIEQMGTGIKKMKELVKAEGLKPIKFEIGDFFIARFTRRPLYPKVLVQEIAQETA